MSNEEKILCFRKKTMEELEEILSNPNSSESDIVIASVELGTKQYELGMYYTTEEVLENVFGKTKMVKNCQ